MKRIALPLALALASASLVSCAPSIPEDAGVSIVASTNVYGSIAKAVAGTYAVVTSIIDNPAQDPHSFEAGARVQLELSRADLIIANGGGYDDFIDTLLTGLGNTSATVIKATDVSGFTPTQIEANEHVWYDLNTAKALADAVAGSLAKINPAHAADYRENARKFGVSASGLSARLAAVAAGHRGLTAMVTEPVPLYLLDAAGFINLTPLELSTAIENGQGVPPAVLNSALDLISTGKISLFVYNEQTAGPETEQLRSSAAAHDVPAIGVTETLPNGFNYLEWMSANVSEVEGALK